MKAFGVVVVASSTIALVGTYLALFVNYIAFLFFAMSGAASGTACVASAWKPACLAFASIQTTQAIVCTTEVIFRAWYWLIAPMMLILGASWTLALRLTFRAPPAQALAPLTQVITLSEARENSSAGVAEIPEQAEDVRASMDGKYCAICIEKITADEEWLPCTHVFHKACIASWFERKAQCPICMHDFATSPESVS